MTLYVTAPFAVAEAKVFPKNQNEPLLLSKIISSNVSLEFPEYDRFLGGSVRTYSAGDSVIYNGYIYTCNVDNNLTPWNGSLTIDEPSGLYMWTRIKTLPNRYRCWDRQVGIDTPRIIGTFTTQADLIEYVIGGLPLADTVHFQGITADEVQIICEVLDDATSAYVETFNETISLGSHSNSNGSYFRWAFYRSIGKSSLTLYGVAFLPESRITIRIKRPSQLAAVGSIVLGQSYEFETLEMDVEVDVLQRSVFEEDGLTTTIVPRPPSKQVTFPLLMARSDVDAFLHIMNDLLNTACLYSAGPDFPEYAVYGFPRNPRVIGKSPYHSYASVEVTEV